jgi:hypothetical protein
MRTTATLPFRPAAGAADQPDAGMANPSGVSR